MAGYNKLNAYDATTRIPQFKGLLQYGDGINGDVCFATDEKNMETMAGVLQPAAACQLLNPTTPAPIETLMHLYRRWHSGTDKDILIAASGNKLYRLDETLTAPAWVEIDFETTTTIANNTWSWATYEINPEGSTASVDVLLISNADDGMFMIVPPYTATVSNNNWVIRKVTTPKKFGVIERYAERIWGGAIKNDPDMLVYSAPFDPTDWDADVDNPEDGAGDINQPSWDGDSFTALRSFGSQLIAFKKTRVWRILGTDPGEYTFKEQYGGGAPYEKTIAVDNERIFMLTRKGVVVYDGLSVSPFYQEYAEKIWKRLNVSHLDQACAILWQHKYYCAIPLDESTVNNAVMIYDTRENTWLLRDDVSVESFLGAEDNLYFTSATTPGKIWLWKENSWENTSTTAQCRWVGPWNDLSYKSIVKGGFEVYFLPEVKSTTTISISIQTEKKIKTKQYTIKPLSSADISRNKSSKQKKLHFGGSGRRFRLIIESTGGSWRLIGGILIISEIDPD